jgi:hypothetical protein
MSEPIRRAYGWQAIAIERNRQVTSEGFAPEHDDQHQRGELLDAALCYGSYASLQLAYGSEQPPYYFPPAWPWGEEWWKPSEDPMRNLAKAGALIAAEIDRLHRATG